MNRAFSTWPDDQTIAPLSRKAKKRWPVIALDGKTGAATRSEPVERAALTDRKALP